MFYVNATIAVVATLGMLFARGPVHALLNVVASFLALATILYGLGAPLPAALEVIVYAGAIMVLFIFVVMLLNVQPKDPRDASLRVSKVQMFMPLALLFALIAEWIWLARSSVTTAAVAVQAVPAKAVAIGLFEKYGAAVEIVSLLLLAGLVGAFYLGQKRKGAHNG